MSGNVHRFPHRQGCNKKDMAGKFDKVASSFEWKTKKHPSGTKVEAIKLKDMTLDGVDIHLSGSTLIKLAVIAALTYTSVTVAINI